ncbi:MAG: 3-methyl-2-oxobutanoate hydroxymethyltransferase [Rickettsiales bacterium]|jgi:3-methyl-2-oxobutanoate hydroxymethyltransferase|nr:3-methyl-2-oxobutanoate hydroxymethyltransferase [Rickettsiales bacterium]
MRVLFEKKQQKEKIVAISCYTAPIAHICANYADIILVGDTVGMTVYGHSDTKSVNMEMMINHGRAVARAASDKNFIVVDMPYGTYESDKNMALANAKRLLSDTGAHAVKLEGGTEIAESLSFLKLNNINVVGHIGLLPQKFDEGEYKVQGKLDLQRKKIKSDLDLLEDLGVDIIVIECVYKEFVDELIKGRKSIFIGIGASEKCDGQILVSDDILGLTYKMKLPSFAKAFVDANKIFAQAVSQYSEEVRSKNFPTTKNLYRSKK